MNFRKSLRNIFGLSQREANGLLVLLPILTLLIFSEPLFEWWWASQEADYSLEKKSLDSLLAHWPKEEIHKTPAPSPRAVVTLHPFNPNEASKKELIALGLSEFSANRIIHFRDKGGTFKIKKDFSKIYGLSPEQFSELEPYIQLPDKLLITSKLEKKEKFASPPSRKYTTPNKVPPTRHNINTCDTAALQKIYGIGHTLANRIISFRNKLGGFVNILQVGEVYGLDSALVNKVKKDFFVEEPFTPTLLKINSLTEKELAQHPYMGYKQARQLCAYRRQHGNYPTIEDIRKNPLITDEVFEKLKPYLSLE